MKDRMTIEFAYHGKTEFDNVRHQKIKHKVYRDVDDNHTLVELIDYEEI